MLPAYIYIIVYSLLPTEGTCTEHGCFAAVERRDEQFGFSLENIERVFLEGFAQRLHQVVARLGEAAEEDDGFGRVERHKVGAGRAKHLAREAKDVERYGAALLGSIEHAVRRDSKRDELN